MPAIAQAKPIHRPKAITATRVSRGGGNKRKAGGGGGAEDRGARPPRRLPHEPRPVAYALAGQVIVERREAPCGGKRDDEEPCQSKLPPGARNAHPAAAGLLSSRTLRIVPGLTGFTRCRRKPAFLERSLSSSFEYAVTAIRRAADVTGFFCSASARQYPSESGSPMSHRTTSGCSRVAASKPSMAVSAMVTS